MMSSTLMFPLLQGTSTVSPYLPTMAAFALTEKKEEETLIGCLGKVSLFQLPKPSIVIGDINKQY